MPEPKGSAEHVHPTEIRTSIFPSSAVELNTTSTLANYATEAVHPTEIRTSISPSSAVELNTTSALANNATEAGSSPESHLLFYLVATSGSELLACLSSAVRIGPTAANSSGATQRTRRLGDTCDVIKWCGRRASSGRLGACVVRNEEREVDRYEVSRNLNLQAPGVTTVRDMNRCSAGSVDSSLWARTSFTTAALVKFLPHRLETSIP
uniref:Uncharacterized protein n=1 Tax=Timema genevievae TaxID=629358 RepID=A0A7R9JP01_TIMGE|nr:unnamed protein product [Timema genevievae]